MQLVFDPPAPAFSRVLRAQSHRTKRDSPMPKWMRRSQSQKLPERMKLASTSIQPGYEHRRRQERRSDGPVQISTPKQKRSPAMPFRSATRGPQSPASDCSESSLISSPIMSHIKKRLRRNNSVDGHGEMITAIDGMHMGKSVSDMAISF